MSIHHSNYNEQKTNFFSTQTMSSILWFFNYYDLAIDNSIQAAVISITSYLLTSSWKDTKFQVNQFLEYAATHPNAKILYHSSQIHLWIHSYAYYLNEYKSHSLNGGFFYLSEKTRPQIKSNDPPQKLNAPVIVNRKIINAVMCQ